MMSEDELIGYRVSQLEAAVHTLAMTTKDLSEFMVSIRVWIRAIALIYGTLQAVILVVIANKL